MKPNMSLVKCRKKNSIPINKWERVKEILENANSSMILNEVQEIKSYQLKCKLHSLIGTIRNYLEQALHYRYIDVNGWIKIVSTNLVTYYFQFSWELIELEIIPFRNKNLTYIGNNFV